MLEDQTSKPALMVALADIEPLLSICRQSGNLDAVRLCNDVQQPSEANTNGVISLSRYFELFGDLVAALHDETLHMSARHLMSGTTRYVISSLAPCTNLGDALRQIAKAYNVLHGGPFNRVEIRSDGIFYIIDDGQFPYNVNDLAYIHFALECVQIFLSGLLTTITTEAVMGHLCKVYTKGNLPERRSTHLDFWQVPVRYQAPYYALKFDLEVAELPLIEDVCANTPISAIFAKVIYMCRQHESLGERRSVRSSVRDGFKSGLIEQSAAARHLGLSVATLRRRLTAENTSFRAERNHFLNRQARQLLDEGLHASAVAEELGFADFRSFTRAFKTWNGETPTRFSRRRARP